MAVNALGNDSAGVLHLRGGPEGMFSLSQVSWYVPKDPSADGSPGDVGDNLEDLGDVRPRLVQGTEVHAQDAMVSDFGLLSEMNVA